MKASERRKFHRINFEEDVFIDFPDNTSDCCRVKNISLGGMFILGWSPRNEIENCQVRIFHNAQLKEPRLRASAKVAWSNEEGVGIQFTAMSYDSYMALLATLLNKAEQPSVILREFPKTCPFEITSD
ncbi:MAG: PilZ domain-containing protein [Desulfobulbaceae bacterium]